MTTTISLEALRDLAAFRARTGCAVSLYLDLDPSHAPTPADVQTRLNSLLDQAHRSLRPGLAHAARDGLRTDLDRVRHFVTTEFVRDGASGLAVFAASADDVWSVLPLAAPVDDAVRVNDEFLIAPLVPLVGQGEGAVVAVVNRERGSLYRLRGGRLAELADLSEDAPSRHDQGGWSQSRFQRHIDELAADHYRTVAEELARQFRRLQRPRIVVVAPEDARHELGEALPSDVADAVIGWTTAEAHASRAALEPLVAPLLDDWRAGRESELVDRWREEAGRDGRAASGWAATLAAASDGRVEVLLAAEGVAHHAVRCPECGRAEADGDTCPLDGAPLERTVDGLDVAVRQALAHGGSVWTVRRRPDLRPVEGLGALLRF